MSESLYRRKPEGNIVDILKGRKQLLNIKQTGGQSPSVRNPAYVYITGHDKSCAGGGGTMSLPRGDETIEETYRYYGGGIKPGPDLEGVDIEYAGDQGLARRISGTIRCYTIKDFEQVQKHFLLPGNEIDVKFGYKKTWGVPQSEVRLKGFTVATFAFSTTQEGFWTATFTAVSAATALKNLDLQITVCNGCPGKDNNIVYFTGKEEKRHPVKGVAQLITADAQVNGQISIDDFKDGEVITWFKDYTPSGNERAAIVIYKGNHLRDPVQGATAWFNSLWGMDEVTSANSQVFCSLGYIVNRVINNQLLRAMGCGVATDKEKFDKIKIVFHPEYSKCKISEFITSADPTTVLLLGHADYRNFEVDGKNFDADCTNLGAVKCKIGAGDINLQNILIHRNVINEIFLTTSKKREAESDSTDIKDTKEELINITDFFQKLSDHISKCVGGSISLRLVENPDNLFELMVIDQNFGVTDKLDCIVFDPIDGDGSTRSCTVQSNVGSEEYKAAMFVGSSKKGDSVAAIRGCTDTLKPVRADEYSKAFLDVYQIIVNPGNLGENYFKGTEIDALKSAMSRLHKNNPDTATNETVHYPGLSISMEIDGVWGFIPGNAISSTQVPKAWRNQYKSYFMVTKVNHVFSQSDWSTKVDGILAYYPNVNFVEL